jgi:H+-translocating NAD(P) transhydrogenase subunit beta
VSQYLVQSCYGFAALVFILGLKRMSSPRSAHSGIAWAGVGMCLAVAATFALPEMRHLNSNLLLILIALALGSGVAWYSGYKVAMTDMPQMIALYNGMGGGAAGIIAGMEWLNHATNFNWPILSLTLASAIIGTVSFSGSLIAFAKLQGWIQRIYALQKQQWLNIGLVLLIVILAIACTHARQAHAVLLLLFIVLLTLGVTLTLPIGGANMPVVISLFNAMTGLAVGLEGFALANPAMMIAGTVVGAAGALLTQLMAKAMNQSLLHILFTTHHTASQTTAHDIQGMLKPIECSDASVLLAYANRVIIVPGYGMAVAQAQHKVWELTQQLEKRHIHVKFAIHPVAGRMPGHMNVLLAEAGVPYDLIADLEEVNAEFNNTDVVLVIGANDVVNPSARNDPNSPIYGMPILNVDHAKQILVIKRGQGTGFSGVENSLFYHDNTRMLYGDGQAVVSQLIQAIKEI